MGGPGSGRTTPPLVRFLVTSWKARDASRSRREVTKLTEAEAVAYGDSLVSARLADAYQIDRVETICRVVADR